MQILVFQHVISRWQIIIVLLLSSLGWGSFAAERAPVGVIVAPVKILDIADTIEALGTSYANEAIVLTSKITEKITKIHFTDGQQVVRNQLLVQLDDQEEQANLRAEQAILAERVSALRRAEELFKRQVGSEADLDAAKARVRQTEADIEAIRARIQAHRLRAPFAGIVGFREVSEGALVEPDDQLTTLDDLSIIKVDFDIPVIHLSKLATGLSVAATTSAFPERMFTGELRSFSSRVDPVTRTVRARAWFDNSDNTLLPGLLMQIELLAQPRTAKVVPESALFATGRKHFTYLIQQPEAENTGESEAALQPLTAVQREIEIGTRSNGFVEVISGVKEGDQVISHGNLKLSQGRQVRIIAVDNGGLDIASVLDNRGAVKTSDELIDGLKGTGARQRAKP